MKLNGYLLRSAVSASLGGLLFGFDTAVIAGTTNALTETFRLSPGELGFTVASALWGTVVGALTAGIPGDRYGRRGCLKMIAALYLLSAIGCACAWNWGSLLFFRFAGGLAIGGSSVLGPLYISEIAPARMRGRLVALFQFNVVFGILVAYTSNYLVGLLALGDVEWRWKLGVPALPALVFLVMLFFIPQSPRWLVQKGQISTARDVLSKIGEEDVEGELQEIAAATEAQSGQAHERLLKRRYAFPVFLAVSIAMFNQLSGINAILYYLNDIFEKSGLSRVSSGLQAVVIGATLLIFTTVAMLVIDRLGRKLLLLIGSVGTAACLAGIFYIFSVHAHEGLLVWLLICYIGFFGLSQGSVIWVYISEVFPTPVRAKGQSLGSFTHWFMDALISGLYPLVAASFTAAPFGFFAVMTILQFFVVLLLYPETKGVSLEQMEEKLGIAQYRPEQHRSVI